jgi:hemerythrin-like metal-binding protein
MSRPSPRAGVELNHDHPLDGSAFLDWLPETQGGTPADTATPSPETLAGMDSDLGIPALDQQHRRLGQLLTALRHSADAGDRPRLAATVEALARLATRHFATEEQLMGAAYYPFLHRHREDHHRLLACLHELRQPQVLDGAQVGEMIADLEHRLRHHFLREDREYAPYLRQSPKRGWLIRMCQALLQKEGAALAPPHIQGLAPPGPS